VSTSLDIYFNPGAFANRRPAGRMAHLIRPPSLRSHTREVECSSARPPQTRILAETASAARERHPHDNPARTCRKLPVFLLARNALCCIQQCERGGMVADCKGTHCENGQVLLYGTGGMQDGASSGSRPRPRRIARLTSRQHCQLLCPAAIPAEGRGDLSSQHAQAARTRTVAGVAPV
jgi:hypothetical protein